MHGKEKKQDGFHNNRNERGNLNDYQRLKAITTMHPVLNEREAQVVKKTIEKLPE